MVDLRSAGIAQSEPARHLVVRLTGGVVDRLAEHDVFAGSRLQDDQTVAARDQQGHERPRQIRALQKRREEMALQMVDADEGHAPGERVGLGRRESDQDRSDQSRPAGHGDPENRGIEGVEPGVGERSANDRSDRRHVGATGQFRNDPAEGPVLVDRGLDHRGEDVELLVDDGGGGLVTTRLDSEDQSHQASVGGGTCGSVLRSAQRIRASSPVFS